jgi:hypothetical protein
MRWGDEIRRDFFELSLDTCLILMFYGKKTRMTAWKEL